MYVRGSLKRWMDQRNRSLHPTIGITLTDAINLIWTAAAIHRQLAEICLTTPPTDRTVIGRRKEQKNQTKSRSRGWNEMERGDTENEDWRAIGAPNGRDWHYRPCYFHSSAIISSYENMANELITDAAPPLGENYYYFFSPHFPPMNQTWCGFVVG